MESSEFSQKDYSIEEEDIQQLIATGSTCYTYRVRLHGKLHTKKQLLPQFVKEDSYRTLLEKEFEIGYNLDIPTLPHYLSKGEDKDGPYLLMEYVDGVSLDEFITDSPEFFKKKANCKHFAQQLLRTLEYLHAKQVLHLDIKPQNILITHIGHELKLVDFGFSYTDAYDINTGHSPTFAAPEQLRGERPYDQRTDLYSAGKVLALVYGKETAFIKKLIQPQPEKRFASATEALSVLEKRTSLRWIVPILLLILLVSSVWILHENQVGTIEERTTVETIQHIGESPRQAKKTSAEVSNQAKTTPIAVKPANETPKEEPWRTEIHQMVDKEFNAFYASYTVLTAENYDTLLAAYQDIVSKLLNVPADICKKYPNVSEQEVSAAVYQELDRITPAFRSQVGRLW